MSRRPKILQMQQCSLADEEGKHDPEKMRETRSKNRITYFCPECGYTTWKKTEDETAETGTGTRKKGGRPRKHAAETDPKPTEEAPETKPRKGGRGVTEAFEDGKEIRPDGLPDRSHTYTLHAVTICWPEKPKTFYEIFREDGEKIGRVSQAVSWQRAENMVIRSQRPESERYPEEGITWTGRLRALRDPRRKEGKPKEKKKKEPTPTLYVTIPKAYVEQYGIMIDDEISAEVIEDNKPDSNEEDDKGKEYYHVSEMSGSKIVVLSKQKRRETRGDAPPRIPRIGELVTIRIKAETKKETKKRRDLCHWADQELEDAKEKGVPIVHPSLDDDLRPRPPETEGRTERRDPKPEGAPAAVPFEDF